MVPSVLITLTEIFTECCNALYIYRPEHKVFDTHTRSIFVHTKMCSYHNLLDVCARIGTLDTNSPQMIVTLDGISHSHQQNTSPHH